MSSISVPQKFSHLLYNRIIDNMSKLVDSAITVRPFVPKLLPGLIKVESSMGDPEARGVVSKAIATLRHVAQVPEGDGSDIPALKLAEAEELAHGLDAVYRKAGAEISIGSTHVIYVSQLAANLVNAKNFDVLEWESLVPYLAFVAQAPEPVSIARGWVVRSASEGTENDNGFEDDEEGEDLCNCQFSLAYGAKILLNTATLRLKRGHRYGLCGKNGTGKSTLMRAITNGFVVYSKTNCVQIIDLQFIAKSKDSHLQMWSVLSMSSMTLMEAKRTRLCFSSLLLTSASSPRRLNALRLLLPLDSQRNVKLVLSAVYPVVGR